VRDSTLHRLLVLAKSNDSACSPFHPAATEQESPVRGRQWNELSDGGSSGFSGLDAVFVGRDGNMSLLLRAVLCGCTLPKSGSDR